MESTNNTRRDNKKNYKKRPEFDLNQMMYGKVPPQAKELEEAVLGAIMLQHSAFPIVSQIVTPESFYVDSHQRIFKAFTTLNRNSLPIDILTVVEQLKKTEELDLVGGPYSITKLTNTVVSTANIESHAKIVQQKFLSREMIRIGGEMIASSYEDSTDIFDLIDESEGKLSSLSITKMNKPYKPISIVVDKALQQILDVKTNKKERTGVPTGLRILDLITQGWQKTNFIIIAARPAIGKSAVAGNLALGAASDPETPTGVGIFSLEMAADQWVIRMLSAESEIEQFMLKRGRITDEEYTHVANVGYQKVANLPIFFDDSPSLNIYQFKSKARAMVLNEGVGLLIVDYLQLMSGMRQGNEIREQEVARISRECKQIAKELNVPLIALSQVGRKGEGGDLKLSDLRESGAIEQDADDVILLIPPSEDDIKKDQSLKDNLILKIAKHRNGTVTEVTVKYVKEIQKIMSESEYDEYKVRHQNWVTTTIPASPQSNDNTINNDDNGKLYIQKGSKMSTGGFDEGLDEASPF